VPLISVQIKQGKLCEIRVLTPVSGAEVSAMIRSLMTLLHAHSTIRGIVDLRGSTVFPDDLAEQIADFLRVDNPSIERAAFVAGTTSAIFNLQLDRVIRGGKSVRRRMFRERGLAEAWMSEVLTPAENRRMREFLSESESERAPPSRNRL
jgi:hypothetical protein